MATSIVGQSPNPGTTPNGGPTVEVRITPTVEREFKRRDIFPHLRIEKARRIINGATGVFDVSIDDAEALLKDAEEQRRRYGELPRGVSTALGSLVDYLRPAIKSAKGLWDDPGQDVAFARIGESSALFKEGDAVRYCSPWLNDPDDGKRLWIVGRYHARRVLSESGAFIARDGKRVDYRPGYVAADNHGGLGATFYPAGQLQTLDYKRGYLRLVETRTASTGELRQ